MRPVPEPMGSTIHATRISREPKVLFVTYEFGAQTSGGVARVINGLAESLRGKIKFDIFLFQWSVAAGNFSGDLYRQGVKRLRYCTPYLETIHDLIKRNGYNVVHILHPSEHTCGLVAYLRQKGVQVEIVFSVHSIMKHDRLLRRSSDQDLFHEKYLIEHSHHIHLLSTTVRQWLQAAYPEYQANRHFHIIPNAIHCGQSGAPVQSRDSRPTVLCISRWSHGKGLEYLLDAIPHVLAAMPDVRFVLAGRKEDSWETDVATYVKKIDEKIRGLEDHIEVFGWIDEARKASLCARAHVAVMPSEVEYFPYALLEPVAAGIPVVSSRIAGAREILEEGRHCLMYETTDSQQLARHILTLLGNPALARQLADNAQQHVSTRYTWERISGLYQEMYVRILGTTRMPCAQVSASVSEYRDLNLTANG